MVGNAACSVHMNSVADSMSMYVCNVCVCVCMCVRMYVCMYVCMCLCTIVILLASAPFADILLLSQEQEDTTSRRQHRSEMVKIVNKCPPPVEMPASPTRQDKVLKAPA